MLETNGSVLLIIDEIDVFEGDICFLIYPSIVIKNSILHLLWCQKINILFSNIY